MITVKCGAVGGGSSGAVLANRLSEDPDTTVLLLEAGGKDNVMSDVPLLAANLQMSPLDWAYQTEPQDHACFGLIDRRSRWPRGKVLGGSSVLNYMLYVRGNRRDYDHWEQMGAEGWGWRDVLPYFLKSEDNRDPKVLQNGYHGVGGGLTVSTPSFATPVAFDFVQAGRYLGYKNVDVNGPTQTGFMIPQGTIRRGARCSTAKAFLRPVRDRPNLDIVIFAYVTKIIIDQSKRARGVQFTRLKMPYKVYARREVIVSAGAINSPQLLMLSGIGPRHHLQSLGIPVVADLPVGESLKDHIYPAGVHYLLRDPVTITPERVTRTQVVMDYMLRGQGPYTVPGGVEGLGFINTKYANHSDDYPDIEIHFLSGCPSSDGGATFKKVAGLSEELWERVYKPYAFRDCISFFPVLLRPKSVGYIRLRSANPYDKPVIQPNYLTHPQDLLTLVD
ncbi:hypothetical protein LAZ67_8000117, partial [Cordylochernes scorpioides]